MKYFSLLGYFLNYIFVSSRTRQSLVWLALIGIFISSLCLVILQGIMSGLQGNIIQENKRYFGSFEVIVPKEKSDVLSLTSDFVSILKSEGMSHYVSEKELEVLIRHTDYLAPLKLHAVDWSDFIPPFLQKSDRSGLILGGDLGLKLKASLYGPISIISPSYTLDLMGSIPTVGQQDISDFYVSGMNEIDEFHGWVRLSFLQNMIRSNSLTSLRFYESSDLPEVKKILNNEKFQDFKIKTWEDNNPERVWAFHLETNVLIVLFSFMCLLVSLTITVSFLLLLDRLRFDLASFWILGLSRNQCRWMIGIFSQGLITFSSLAGVLSGVIFLWILKLWSPNIMPDVFWERTLPVKIEFLSLMTSWLVPQTLASVFCVFVVYFYFHERISFLSIVRRIGS
ncbi:MAG: hypothetical protein QE271_03625 [Bacteriovoracaceae bacterium]|nr:hypothetical protein [Bacteriovoracaceae bacterium]